MSVNLSNKMNKTSEKYKLPKLTQEVNNLDSYILSKEIKFIVKNHCPRKFQA